MSKDSDILDNHTCIKKHVTSSSENNGDRKRDRKNIYEEIKDKKYTKSAKKIHVLIKSSIDPM